ncbi:MAG: hypothetical protein LBN33_04880 [Desulfovibrio sp.]|jgi:hypothetical protein|nr:hypothetical protein [Desulfovibrio sp.]
MPIRRKFYEGFVMEEFKLDTLLFVICLAGVSLSVAIYKLIQYLSLRKESPAEEREAACAAFKKDLNPKKLILIVICFSCLLSSAWVTKDLSRTITLLTCFFIIYLLLLGGRKKQP